MTSERRPGWYVLIDKFDGKPAAAAYTGKLWDFMGRDWEYLPSGWTIGPRIDGLLRDAERYQKLLFFVAADLLPNMQQKTAWEKGLTLQACVDAEIAREKESAGG